MLLHRGYTVLISSDGSRLVTYSTLHKERTWPQVKAGVESRTRPQRRPQPQGDGSRWRVSLVDVRRST